MRKSNYRSLPRHMLESIRESNITHSSVMIAYYFILSLFPLTVCLVTLLPYFHIDPQQLIPYLEALLPEPVYAVLMPMLHGLLTTPNGGLLSLSILVTLWSASRSITYIQQGIEEAYGMQLSRLYLLPRLVSAGTLVLIILLLVMLTLLFSIGDTLLDRLALVGDWPVSASSKLRALQWPVPIFGLLFTFVLIYLTTPNLKLRVWDVLPGAVLAMAVLMLSTRLFALYINYAIQPLTAYGTLSSIFILMLYMRLIGYIILMGAILNAALYETRHGGPPERRHKAEDYVLGKLQSIKQRIPKFPKYS